MNTYDLDAEACPECDEKELVYAQVCNGIHCQNCGAWFNLAGELLEEEA
jgi:uncharacterized protein YbaR (Trm112 family)